jgi:ABC-2 type transport system ATP-binding protein
MAAAAIEVEALSKTFQSGRPLPFVSKRRSVEALKDVCLTIETGEIFGLVGRNGYGKTTLIKCIASLIEPTHGRVRVLGHDATKASRALRRSIGLVSSDERSFYWRLSGLQNLLFFSRLQGLPAGAASRRIEELAGLFEVSALLDRRFQEYSSGNRQRLAMVRALLHDPRVLILDEPTRSLDPFAATTLRRALCDWVSQARDRSVLITSHNLDEVEQLSHRVGIMSRGRLREQGTVEELRRKYDSHERIVIETAGVLGGEQLSSLREIAADVVSSPRPDGGHDLVFRRPKGSALLDRILKQLVTFDLQINGFERSELSLQDIIDRVDTEPLDAR